MTTLLAAGYGPDMGGTGRGITRLHLASDGSLSVTGTLAEASSPSWLLPHERGVWAAGENDGAVGSWAFGASGLEPGPRVDAGGDAPCHLVRRGGDLLVANYGGGTLGAVPLDGGMPAADAAVVLRDAGTGPHPAQDHAHVHGSLPLDDGRVLVADLGTDEVVVVVQDGGGWRRVGAVSLPAGSGPRDLVAVGAERVLLLTELGAEIVLLDTAPEIPVVLSTVGIPGREPGDHAAALALQETPGGLRVHAGLRGSNRVGVVLLAGDSLTPVGAVDCGGDWPRHVLAVDGFLLVSNQGSGDVAVFAMDAAELPRLLATTPVPTPTQTVVVPDDPWSALVPVS